MKLFPIIILFAFGAILIACSSIPEQHFHTKGISPREVFIEFDSSLQSQVYVYLDKKLSQFKLTNDDELIITSIRTDEIFDDNTCYKLENGNFKVMNKMPSAISYKLGTKTIHQLSKEFESNIQFNLDSNNIRLDLKAVSANEYLYCYQAETGKRNRISWMLSIYAVADSTMQIKKILYYYSGDKVE